MRFAPSPSGPLHLGHAYSAMFTAVIAEATHGTFLLRMEDIDSTRCDAKWEQAIERDLTALGISWPTPVLRQSDRGEAYKTALEQLHDKGVVYPCFCTRGDIAAEIAQAANAPHGPDGPHYPGICRALTKDERQAKIAAGLAHAWRLNVEHAAKLAGPLMFEQLGKAPEKAMPNIFGDIVVARKDIGTSYHLACVVDDAAQGITLVTRGQDLEAACHVQRLLQALLGLPVPRYTHHRLVGDAERRRLAKRAGDMGLSEMIAQGRSPQQILDKALSALI